MIGFLSSIILSGTEIILQPSQEPGAIAEVIMDNKPMNGASDDGRYPLEIDGLAVWLVFTWDAGEGGQDRIQVDPPRGVLCVPVDCILTLQEGSRGKVLLYTWVGS